MIMPLNPNKDNINLVASFALTLASAAPPGVVYFSMHACTHTHMDISPDALAKFISVSHARIVNLFEK